MLGIKIITFYIIIIINKHLQHILYFDIQNTTFSLKHTILGLININW